MPVAVVTGANRGLGLETARELVRRGYVVWLTARQLEGAQEAAAELKGSGSARPARLDVGDSSSIASFAELVSGDAPIDALVNNAGVTFRGFDAKVARDTLAVNYRGPVEVTDALSRSLAPRANIVMVSSGMGELSNVSAPLRERLLDPKLTRADVEALANDYVAGVGRGESRPAGLPQNAYSVSKVLLNAFTRCLARELSGSGRHVNAVCPGWVRTRMGGSAAPRSLQHGASGIVWAATLPPDGPSGGFFRDGKPIDW